MPVRPETPPLAAPPTSACAPAAADVDAPPHTTWLDVGDGQRMAVQLSGAADGLPVLLLHGGPGSGPSPLLRRAFDPARYRVIAPAQRGCGDSQPAGTTQTNTTAHLLADLRQLHRQLGGPRWLVVGGSWGATLALAHAADCPQAVAALLLRASFLGREDDVAAFFAPPMGPGCREQHDLGPAADTAASGPAAAAALAEWQALADAAGLALDLAGKGPDGAAAGPERAAVGLALARALHQRLQATDPAQPDAGAQALARAWWHWEQRCAGTARPGLAPPAGDALLAQVRRYRIQAHYLAHACWLQPPLLQRLHQLPAVPVQLLHADDDGVCPPAGARRLLQGLQDALGPRTAAAGLAPPALRWVPGAGHDPAHPAMAGAQRALLDHYALHQRWPAPH